MKKKEMIKGAAEFVIASGTAIICGSIIKNNTSNGKGAFSKLCVAVAGFVITNMISEKTVEYFDKKFDDAIEDFRNFIDKDKRWQS